MMYSRKDKMPKYLLKDEQWAVVKSWFRSMFKVEEIIRNEGCISCARAGPLGKKPWKSKQGEREYKLSGCCEKCFDIYEASEPGERPGSPHLTNKGQDMLFIFVFFVNKAREGLVLSRPAAQQFLSWALNVEEPPVLFVS